MSLKIQISTFISMSSSYKKSQNNNNGFKDIFFMDFSKEAFEPLNY